MLASLASPYIIARVTSVPEVTGLGDSILVTLTAGGNLEGNTTS